MDSTDKSSSKNIKATQGSIYNPWNLFTTRNRTESETSVSSTSSQNSQSGTQYGGLQRQTTKNNEEYLWMILPQ
ncbi:unnamed protein product [Arctia plantaginis]|uniref:Uncharacterized protein n=1 Tax=Arctia plantaginis TaxID=874455 RepID=A0A8S1BDD3_ARCPL|nr:unnamed protein product [Arctia plantaginis]